MVPTDASRYLAEPHEPVQLALADPPYSFDAWDELLRRVPAPVVVAESDRSVEPPTGWSVLRAKRYGGTHVTFLTRGEADPL